MLFWLKGLVVQGSLSLSKGAYRREPDMFPSRKAAKDARRSQKNNHFLASLAKNFATLAVPYLPSSVPESPLALGTKGYRPQLRSSDFILRSPITYMPYKPLHVLYGKKI